MQMLLNEHDSDSLGSSSNINRLNRQALPVHDGNRDAHPYLYGALTFHEGPSVWKESY